MHNWTKVWTKFFTGLLIPTTGRQLEHLTSSALYFFFFFFLLAVLIRVSSFQLLSE